MNTDLPGFLADSLELLRQHSAAGGRKQAGRRVLGAGGVRLCSALTISSQFPGCITAGRVGQAHQFCVFTLLGLVKEAPKAGKMIMLFGAMTILMACACSTVTRFGA